MSDRGEQLNLFDFGFNKSGEYTNLVEEEKQLQDISEKELNEFIQNHENPLIRIADYFFCGYQWDGHCFKDIANRLEKIVATKCYHYGNMKKDLYIFSLYDKHTDEYILVFQNENHYLGFECNGFYIENKDVVNYSLDDYLLHNKASIVFPALYCPCFDLKGNLIEEYGSGEYWQKDIRHIVCIKEWQMDKFSKNRIQEGKKVKDFYEVEFYLKDLINYWGQ